MTTLDEEYVKQMDLDLPRTYPNLLDVRLQEDVIRGVLLQHIANDKELGYCQGMNYVATVFVAASRSPEEASERFGFFMRRARGLWVPGLPLMVTGAEKFVSLAHGRPWFQHLEAHSVSPSMYLPQAWLAFFGTWLPLKTMVDCLSFFEREAHLGLLSMTLGILDHVGDSLVAQPDMESVLNVLGSLRGKVWEPPVLLGAAREWLPAAAIAVTPQRLFRPLAVRRRGARMLTQEQEYQDILEDISVVLSAASSVVMGTPEEEVDSYASALLLQSFTVMSDVLQLCPSL